MRIREQGSFDGHHSRFDASAADATLRELEDQHAAGQIDTSTYFVKKRALVRLFLKATTSPTRRNYDEYDGV